MFVSNSKRKLYFGAINMSLSARPGVHENRVSNGQSYQQKERPQKLIFRSSPLYCFCFMSLEALPSFQMNNDCYANQVASEVSASHARRVGENNEIMYATEKFNSQDVREGKLFIGGISWQTTGDVLKEYFEQFGTVIDVSIMVDKGSGRPR